MVGTWLNVCMNYEFNLLLHVGVVAKTLRAAAAAHEGDDNTPTGPTGRGVTHKLLYEIPD